MIKTAAKFLDKGNFNNTTDMLIEFAKLHVEAALILASSEINMPYNERTKFILNAYPLDLIK